jgi:hypothetical protein
MGIITRSHPSINTAEFGFNLSSDGGSNYNVTKTSSAFVTYHNEADNDTAVAYYGIDLAQSTNNQKTGDYSINIHCGGYGNTTSAINAIDFKFASGNIDAGTIYMYGIE